MHAYATSAPPLTVAERLRVLANQFDAGDDRRRIARQLAIIIGELIAETATRARPALAGAERLYTTGDRHGH